MTKAHFHPADRAGAPWRRECFYSMPSSMTLKRKKSARKGVSHG
jgi:hypothetical protein